MSTEALTKQATSKRFGNNLPYVQKKWLRKVYKKWQDFLNKINDDAKNYPILEYTKNIVFNIASEIYEKDGKSLDKWLTESTQNNTNDGEYGWRQEVSISTYKEQFKNMLSLDLWLDKLLEWQINSYKLQMPEKKQVDPLIWNQNLKKKLNEVMKEEKSQEITIPIPKTDHSSIRDDPMMPDSAPRHSDYQRKRTYLTAFPGMDPMHSSEQMRLLKMKKFQETEYDAK